MDNNTTIDQILRERTQGWDKQQTLWEIYSYLNQEIADLEQYVTYNEDADGNHIPPSDDQRENYYDGKTHAFLDAMKYIEEIQEDCGYIATKGGA